MNNHHPLCYNDEWEDYDCELCQVIRYVISSMIPPCTCGSTYDNYMSHSVGCRYGSFFHSQFGRGIL